MKTEFKRREFLNNCAKAGLGCCIFMSGVSVFAQDNKDKGKKPDPKMLNYCGYTCSNDCALYKATIENNIELKKKAYEDFKFKENYNIDFDPDKVFCWGCKINDKPLSMAVNACAVRKCVIEKNLECCIQCNDLKICEKDLWKNFPKFKERVIEMRNNYLAKG